MLGGGMGDFAGRDSNAIDVESWGGPDQDVSVDPGSIGGMLGSPDADLGGAAGASAIDVEGWGPVDRDVTVNPEAIGGVLDRGPDAPDRTPDQKYRATIRELIERGFIKYTPSGILSFDNVPQDMRDQLMSAFKETAIHGFRDKVKAAAGRTAGQVVNMATGMAFGTVAAAAAPAAMATIEGQVSGLLAKEVLGGFLGSKVEGLAQQGILESSAMRALGVPESLADQRVNAHYNAMAPQETPASTGPEVSPNQAQAGQLAAARAAEAAKASQIQSAVSTAPAISVPQNYPNRYADATSYRKSRLSGRQSVVNQLTNARARF